MTEKLANKRYGQVHFGHVHGRSKTHDDATVVYAEL